MFNHTYFQKETVNFPGPPQTFWKQLNEAMANSFKGFLVLLVFTFLGPVAFQGKNRTYILPQSLTMYLNMLFPFFCFCLLIMAVFVFIQLFKYWRNVFDYKAGYIQTATLEITRILDLGNLKRVHLENGRILKVNYDDYEFNKIQKGGFVEIKKSASDKDLQIKFLLS